MIASTTQILTLMTLGELVRKRRKEANLTLPQLAEKTGFNKGVLSKIENGDTKRPEWKTIRSIALALDIPYEVIIERYCNDEQRAEVLRLLLTETVQLSNIPLLSKVAYRFLQSPQIDTCTALQYVYETACKSEDINQKLALYEVTAQYARDHGVQLYAAKSLLSKYVIERDDFQRLEETYRIGVQMLNYINYLEQAERTTAYYKLALHAYHLKLYKECIYLGEQGLQETTAISTSRASVVIAMINSFSVMGDFTSVEKYIEVYQQFPYEMVAYNIKFIRANMNARKGNYNVAMEQLKQLYTEAGDRSRLHVANKLLEYYLQTNELDAMRELCDQEEQITKFHPVSPLKMIELGNYYRLKAKYQLLIGEFEAGINSMLTSIQTHKEVGVYTEINESVKFILASHQAYGKHVTQDLIENLGNIHDK